MEQTRNTRRPVLIAAIALIVVAAVFLTVYLLYTQQPVAGAKTLTVKIIHGDESSRELSIRTDAEFLRQALEEQALISGDESEFGLFIKTVDGETADESLQQWWCITKGGGQLMTGADSTPVQDGEQYELTLTTGY